MLPFGTIRLISRRTTWSSNANATLSNTTASEAVLSSDLRTRARGPVCSNNCRNNATTDQAARLLRVHPPRGKNRLATIVCRPGA